MWWLPRPSPKPQSNAFMNHLLVIAGLGSDVDPLCQELSGEGFRITHAFGVEEGMLLALTKKPDLVLLDVLISRKKGWAFIEQFKKEPRTFRIPIIAFSRDSDDLDGRIRALALGANDFLSTPFNTEELKKRVSTEIALRELSEEESGQQNGKLLCGAIKVDATTLSASVNGRPLSLSPREFRMLITFVKSAGRVFSRDELLQSVWGPEEVDKRSVDTYVYRLRGKIGKKGPPLRTVRGQGYQLVDSRERA